MSETDLIRHVSGAWDQLNRRIRLRLQTDPAEPSHEFVMAAEDIQLLVTLLLQLSSKFTVASAQERKAAPLHPSALGVGETDDGNLVLQLDVGETPLAFEMTPHMCQKLGYALITVAAARRPDGPAN